MTTASLTRCTETTISKVEREFPFTDTKGRQFGARAQIVRRDFVAVPDGIYSRQPCTVYEMRPHALRAGVSYGAWQRGKEFATEAEALAAVEPYFRAAEKRASKNKARA